MDNLIRRKEEIVRDHTAKLVETNSKILELLSNTLKDKKVKADVKVKILNFVNAAGGGGSESSLDMNSDARLELAKGFLSNAGSMMDVLRSDAGHLGLLKNIDDQLELYRKELEAIDKE